MTRGNFRLALAASWLLVAVVLCLTFTPETASGWLTWCVVGLALPAGLWVVSAPAPVTMSEAIHRGRD
ncbi:hypothetical protein TBR22_A14770 [Luteitalea sp. TBR-22]|uniref:hypothetical protein n=1 Tax=Luteitalea sp. TBR-22 TaxID=2802971 RepID=UPI001AF367C0|nr:hypothetical protein [Luteitalea sp. TBR-22]BCS32267.1 hypothetical protein TBR22_A14770 [Luteitalea sp. TBR-22]